MLSNHHTYFYLHIPGAKTKLRLRGTIKYLFFPAFDKSMREKVNIQSITIPPSEVGGRPIEIIGLLPGDKTKELEKHILSMLKKKGH